MAVTNGVEAEHVPASGTDHEEVTRMSEVAWTPLEWMTRALERALLWARPAGGQGQARRNAWVSMVRDNQRRADRLEAARSVQVAISSAERQSAAV
jgi:hypothetical protein